MEENFDSFAHSFSDKIEAPVYTCDLSDPLGREIGARKIREGSDSLGDLFPDGEEIRALIELLTKVCGFA